MPYKLAQQIGIEGT